MVEWITDEERAQIEALVKANAPFWQIRAELNHRSRHAVARAIRRATRPQPQTRIRSPLRLSLEEREEISRGLAAGESLRSIAARIGRAPSTVSREVNHNGGPARYRASKADLAAERRARRPKLCKLALNPLLAEIVEDKLERKWSPEQISGWLARRFPHRPELQVSHETIYLSLFVQTRGALRRELTQHLRTKRANRRPRGYSPMNGQGQLRNTVHISQRPAEANDRAVPGHWEGDLVCGKGMSAIATLVDRQSRFVMLIGLPGDHTAPTVADALAAKITELPDQLQRSLTWDHGKEMAKHAEFTVATGVPVYFCDPRSPWQRGSNENTNGLLRQYLSKKTDMYSITQDRLDEIAAELNGRPRQTLEFLTPSEALTAALR